MKISHLEIRNYKQFKDLSLDLTYPKGHDKEGQPLDKICIIGQSGTGKTNLLNIIKKSTLDISGFEEIYKPFGKFAGNRQAETVIINNFVNQNKDNIKVLYANEKNQIESDSDNILIETEKNYFIGTNLDSLSHRLEIDFKDLNMSEPDKILYRNLRSQLSLATIANISLSLPLLSLGGQYNKISDESKNEKESNLAKLRDKIKELELKYNSNSSSISDYLEKSNIKNNLIKHIVDVNTTAESWNILKMRIDKYKEDEQNHQSILFNKIMNDDDFSKEDSIKEMKSWQDENENLLVNISSDINMILKKFNLELTKIDANQEDYNSLTIKDLSNGNILDYDSLSTGTKNLLSTFIPLKSFSPKDSIILIDEPEMSFYPDIQKKLVDLYTSVGENNQLIVATHSPIIASSFEPWEVVELKFDDDNQIYREDYFEGEKCKENYTLDPRMLTWTGILTDIFDLKEDSNFSVREKGLMDYATLKSELKMTEDMKEKELKFKELQKLSKKLGLDS